MMRHKYQVSKHQRSFKFSWLLSLLCLIPLYMLFPIFGFPIKVLGDEFLPTIASNTIVWIKDSQEIKVGDLILIYAPSDTLKCPVHQGSFLFYQLLTKSSCFTVRRVVGIGSHEYQVKNAKVIKDQHVYHYQNISKDLNDHQWYEFINNTQAYPIYLPSQMEAQYLNVETIRLNTDQLFVLCDHRIQCLHPQKIRHGIGAIQQNQVLGVLSYQITL